VATLACAQRQHACAREHGDGRRLDDEFWEKSHDPVLPERAGNAESGRRFRAPSLELSHK
jgi:hypothetical protein